MLTERLRVEKLFCTKHNTRILNGMQFCLYQGEILGLTGLNGSGRSTLANILSGLQPFDSGAVYVDGKCERITDVERAQKLGIFCVRHKTTLIPELSLLDNMCLPRWELANALYFPTNNLKHMAGIILDELQTEIPFEEPEHKLSLAQSHRLEICRAVFCGAKVLILDDILLSYTEQEEHQLGELLRQLQKREVSVIFIDSRPEPLCRVCTRIIAMEHGRNVGVFYQDDFDAETIRKVLAGASFQVRRLQRDTNASWTVCLRAEGICTDVLNGAEFIVHAGETVGFIPKNMKFASGIVELLCGRAPIKSGRLTLNGSLLATGGGPAAMVQQGVFFLEYYKNCIFPQLTVLENLTIASLAQLSKGPTIRKRMERFVWNENVKKLGIPDELMDQPIRKVDNLTQMKIALYKLLLTSPKVILLNNVFSGTDVLLYNCICDFIAEAESYGIAIVYTAPVDDNVYEVCNRVYQLHDGRTIEIRFRD